MIAVARRLVRLPLRLMPAEAVVPVVRGPLAGCRWIAGAGTHGCWLGTYEREAIRAFVDALAPGETVFDIGAHAGYYTIGAARRVGRRGRVVAFEPHPVNLDYLRRHVRLNDLRQVLVLPMAVADVTGEAAFEASGSRFEGRLSPAGGTAVKVSSLDDLSGAGTVPDPDVIKIDVEGAEERVLLGAAALIERVRPAIFLAAHSPALYASCLQWLVARGYDVGQSHADVIVARHPGPPPGDAQNCATAARRDTRGPLVSGR
jgi:FkbM family methyltransferase